MYLALHMIYILMLNLPQLNMKAKNHKGIGIDIKML